MRKAMGPILTTGVALVAAAVVVANPVAPPVRDLQISTTQLSTNPGSLIPFDRNLLKSISQPSAASPFDSALAQILGALAAEADRIGTEVNSDPGTSLAPAASASQPSAVYTPPSTDVPPGTAPNGTSSATTTVAAEVVAASTPILQQVVSDITADTAYLGNKVVEAAYAAVDAIISTPYLIFKAVRAVLVGDLATLFATIEQAVRAFFNPGLILVGGIDDVVDHYLPPTKGASVARVVASDTGGVVAPPAVAGEGTSSTESETTIAEPRSGKPRHIRSTGSARVATIDVNSSIDRPQLTPRSSASAPTAANPSHSVGAAGSNSAGQPKSKAAGTDKPGSASSGRSNVGGRGASAGD